MNDIKDHSKCAFFATEENSVFRQYVLEQKEGLPVMNAGCNVLLYVIEGRVSVVLGNYTPHVISGGDIIFVPKNIGFYGQAKSGSRLLACLFPNEPQLCNKYDLLKLQNDAMQHSRGLVPPPITPGTFQKSLKSRR